MDTLLTIFMWIGGIWVVQKLIVLSIVPAIGISAWLDEKREARREAKKPRVIEPGH